jgi:hypothetical protein
VAGALSHQALSGLIGSIYDCTLDPCRWEPAMADIMAALDCRHIALTFSDRRDDRLLLHKAVGLAPGEIEQAAKYLPEVRQAELMRVWTGLIPLTGSSAASTR